MLSTLRQSLVTLLLVAIPAGAFAMSVGFAASVLLRQPLEIGAPAAAAAGSFALAWLFLGRMSAPANRYTLPDFEQTPLPEAQSDAATESEEENDADELLLVDAISGPDAPVIRLFDPSRLPSAGELQQRIDRHIASSRTPPRASDSGDELAEALDALRQSLR